MQFKTTEELVNAIDTKCEFIIHTRSDEYTVQPTYAPPQEPCNMLVSIGGFITVAQCHTSGSNLILTDYLGINHCYCDVDCETLPIIILAKIV